MKTTAARAVETLCAAVPRALPAGAYSRRDMTRLEYERLLKPSWQIVCHVSSVAAPGDYCTLDLGPDSIVAIRDSNGEVRAFHNVCRHRGARILEGAGSCPGAITCPYHGWSYRLTGELRAMTARETFPALDRGLLGLKPVRVQVMFGFVFVCLAGTPRPLQEIWEGVAGEFAPHRFEEMRPLGTGYIEHWECDWKIAMDNYLESYHVPIGHPGLYRMFTPDYEDQATVPGVARGLSWLREKRSSRWSEGLYQSLIGKAAGDLPEDLRRCWRFYSALPNLGMDVFPDQMDFFQVLPAGPGKCIIRGGVFGLPGTARELRAARFLSNRINTSVNNEDKWLCARVQRGLASSSYPPGHLSRLESCMLEFHNLLRARIPEFRLPAPPLHFNPG